LHDDLRHDATRSCDATAQHNASICRAIDKERGRIKREGATGDARIGECAEEVDDCLESRGGMGTI
jgi:hypothetical protein